MKSHALFTILIAICLTAPECRKGGASLPPEQAAQARHEIVDYLECDECKDGELEAVVKLGQLTVPVLATALLEGPSQAKLELVRRGLITNYRKLKAYEQTHPEVKVPGTEEQYVKAYLNNYVASTQTKAALALGTVGGADAKRALEEASRKPLGGDVKAVIKLALEKIN